MVELKNFKENGNNVVLILLVLLISLYEEILPIASFQQMCHGISKLQLIFQSLL
jgi:hypothetical protein